MGGFLGGEYCETPAEERANKEREARYDASKQAEQIEDNKPSKWDDILMNWLFCIIAFVAVIFLITYILSSPILMLIIAVIFLLTVCNPIFWLLFLG